MPITFYFLIWLITVRCEQNNSDGQKTEGKTIKQSLKSRKHLKREENTVSARVEGGNVLEKRQTAWRLPVKCTKSPGDPSRRLFVSVQRSVPVRPKKKGMEVEQVLAPTEPYRLLSHMFYTSDVLRPYSKWLFRLNTLFQNIGRRDQETT